MLMYKIVMEVDTMDNKNNNKSNKKKTKNSKQHTEIEDARAILDKIESKVFRFIFFFVLFCLTLILAASVVNRLPISSGNSAYMRNPFQELATAISTFVSIIVGLIAMVMSIISLFFSFYNTKQSYDTHDEYLEKFININHSLEMTLEKEKDNLSELKTIGERIRNYSESTERKIEEKFDKVSRQVGKLHDNLSKNNIETQPPVSKVEWGNDLSFEFDEDFDEDFDEESDEI